MRAPIEVRQARVEAINLEPVKEIPVVLEATTERKVILPQMAPAELPQKQVEVVVEKVVEPPPPLPVVVKTIHEETVI